MRRDRAALRSETSRRPTGRGAVSRRSLACRRSASCCPCAGRDFRGGQRSHAASRVPAVLPPGRVAPPALAPRHTVALTRKCHGHVELAERVAQGARDLVMDGALVENSAAGTDGGQLLLPFGEEWDVREGLVGVGYCDEDEGEGGHESHEDGLALQRPQHGVGGVETTLSLAGLIDDGEVVTRGRVVAAQWEPEDCQGPGGAWFCSERAARPCEEEDK